MEVDDLSKIGDNSPPLKLLDVVERQVMRSDGVYVDGSIQGIKVTFTADTGAARTVISSKLFRKIPNSKKPRLERSSALASVNGQPLTEMGKAVFNITLGNLTLDSELIVAEIEDEALLGLDTLMKGKFDEITVLAAPVSAVKITLIPCILPST
jgi:predicted aspartyl protease